jgi:hypothetical protein
MWRNKHDKAREGEKKKPIYFEEMTQIPQSRKIFGKEEVYFALQIKSHDYICAVVISRFLINTNYDSHKSFFSRGSYRKQIKLEE